MKKLIVVMAFACMTLPFSQGASAGGFKKCSLLLVDLLLVEEKTIEAAIDKGCKSGNAAKGDAKGAKLYSKIVTRWNTKGKKMFDKGLCDPDLNLDAGDFAQPTVPPPSLAGYGEDGVVICDGVLAMP